MVLEHLDTAGSLSGCVPVCWHGSTEDLSCVYVGLGRVCVAVAAIDLVLNTAHSSFVRGESCLAGVQKQLGITQAPFPKAG